MSRSQSPQHRPSSDVKPAQSHHHHHHHHHHQQKQQPPPDATATSDSKDSLSRPQRSNLDLEPNPFEQSFAPTAPPPSLPSSASSPIRRNSTVSVVSSQSKSDSSVTSGPPRTPSSSSGRTRDGSPPSPPKPILPPIESIASPSDQYQWGFSSSHITNSLRAGPLSPAMLAGPQQANGDGTLAFDPSNFRTGLTPRTALTPGTGLTPLIGGPVSFPPPSPNTAAFLNMMSSSVSGGATITPNTLNAITGVLASSAAAANGTNSSQPHPLSVSHLPPSGFEQRPQNYPNGTSTQSSDSRFSNTTNNAANTAANGLFLLSQAHQELTKREEAQRANRSDGDDDAPPSNASSKRGTKRKSYDVSASPPPHQPKPAPPKRTRGMPNGKPKRGDSISVEEDEEDEEDEYAVGSPPELSSTQMNGKKGGQRKPETEEEKR